MKIFGMGGIELIIILVVILIIFGPKNLPKLGKAIGKAKRAAGDNPAKKAGEHLKGVTTMFGDFAEEFKKASK